MPQLFTSLKVRNIVFKNRLVVSPMCQYSATDGFANDWHFVHIGSRVVGGAGLIFMEASAILPEGRITPSDLGIWKDEHIEPLQKTVQFVKAQGAEAGIQLAHAGRKASVSTPWNGNKLIPENEGGWQTVAPTAIAFSNQYKLPKELTEAEIQQVVISFQSAAIRSQKAGFSVLEIHAAHGYLIHQFLSPLSNQREDKYGGSFGNRIRLLLEIVEAVRMVWPDNYPLFVRISATDWTEGGWSEADSVQLSKILKTKGVDVIDCSSGGLIPHAKVPVGPSYQVPFSEHIKKSVDMLTGAVGMITDSAQAESIIVTGQADLIFMAREMLRDPYFPLRAAAELGYKEMPWPVQYERAKFHA